MDNEEFCRKAFKASLVSVILGFPIWAGIYFGVYEPLLDRDWKSSVCTVMDSSRIQNTQTFTYVEYKVRLELEGNNYTGIACGSDRYKDGIASYQELEGENVYPYEYYKSQMLPRWLCSPEISIPVNTTLECKWWIEDKNLLGKNISDTVGESIEVMLKEDTYTPKADYLLLWIVPFGFMTVFPGFLIVALILIYGCAEDLNYIKFSLFNLFYTVFLVTLPFGLSITVRVINLVNVFTSSQTTVQVIGGLTLVLELVGHFVFHFRTETKHTAVKAFPFSVLSYFNLLPLFKYFSNTKTEPESIQESSFKLVFLNKTLTLNWQVPVFACLSLHILNQEEQSTLQYAAFTLSMVTPAVIYFSFNPFHEKQLNLHWFRNSLVQVFTYYTKILNLLFLVTYEADLYYYLVLFCVITGMLGKLVLFRLAPFNLENKYLPKVSGFLYPLLFDCKAFVEQKYYFSDFMVDILQHFAISSAEVLMILQEDLYGFASTVAGFNVAFFAVSWAHLVVYLLNKRLVYQAPLDFRSYSLRTYMNCSFVLQVLGVLVSAGDLVTDLVYYFNSEFDSGSLEYFCLVFLLVLPLFYLVVSSIVTVGGLLKNNENKNKFKALLVGFPFVVMLWEFKALPILVLFLKSFSQRAVDLIWVTFLLSESLLQCIPQLVIQWINNSKVDWTGLAVVSVIFSMVTALKDLIQVWRTYKNEDNFVEVEEVGKVGSISKVQESEKSEDVSKG